MEKIHKKYVYITNKSELKQQKKLKSFMLNNHDVKVYTVMNFQDTPNEWWMEKLKENVILIDNNLFLSVKYSLKFWRQF